MKKIFVAGFILSSLLFSSCYLFHKTAKSDVLIQPQVSSTSGGDGTTYDDAVIVNEKDQTAGVAAEYDWLKENYPGYSLVKTTLEYNDSVPYDVIEIKTADGTKKKVYFDISEYFGKF